VDEQTDSFSFKIKKTIGLVHWCVVLTPRLLYLFNVFVDQIGEGTVMVTDLGEHEAK